MPGRCSVPKDRRRLPSPSADCGDSPTPPLDSRQTCDLSWSIPDLLSFTIVNFERDFVDFRDVKRRLTTCLVEKFDKTQRNNWINVSTHKQSVDSCNGCASPRTL